jgi:hypothetical protein
MPRQNTGQELYKFLTNLSKFMVQSGGGDTTTSASLAVGASTVTTAAITNFTNGDPVCIDGDGGTELNAINGTVATSEPLKYKSAFAQSSGARFVEMVEKPLGHIDENGITFGVQQQLNPVVSAISRVPIGYLVGGPGEMSLSVALRGFNNLNFQTMYGLDEAETGTGTSADPYQAAIGLVNLGSHGLLCFRASGTLYDGRTVTQDFCGAKVEVNGSIQIGSSRPPVIPLVIKYTNIIQRIWT